VVVLAILAFFSTMIVYAAATARGVALWDFATCGNGSINPTLTTDGASREYYRVTNGAGDVLLEAEQDTMLSNFDGTFDTFYMSFGTQPEGTIITSYVYIGETPPNPSNTVEFLVRYRCGTPNEVLSTCYGPYGACTGQGSDSEGSEDGAADNRLNWGYGDAHIAILYPAEDAIDVYNYATGRYIADFITAADIPDTPPAEDLILRQEEGVTARIIPTGEIVFNLGPDAEGKTYAFVMQDIDGTGSSGRNFDPNQ
jgi:hypothetical protein